MTNKLNQLKRSSSLLFSHQESTTNGACSQNHLTGRLSKLELRTILLKTHRIDDKKEEKKKRMT